MKYLLVVLLFLICGCKPYSLKTETWKIVEIDRQTGDVLIQDQDGNDFLIYVPNENEQKVLSKGMKFCIPKAPMLPELVQK